MKIARQIALSLIASFASPALQAHSSSDQHEDFSDFFGERPSTEAAPSSATMASVSVSSQVARLMASEEGRRCIAYLKKGGKEHKETVALASTTALLGAGTVIGTILSAPTIVGPVLIGTFGSALTFSSGSAAGLTGKIRKRQIKVGKLLEAAYVIHGLQEGAANNPLKAAKRLMNYRDNKIAKVKSNTNFTVESLAEKLVILNESGHFCRARVFEDRGLYLPSYVGSLAFYNTDFKYGQRLATALIQAPANPVHIDQFQNALEFHRRDLSEIEQTKAERDARDQQLLQRIQD